MKTLDEFSLEYVRSEITSLFIHERNTNRFVNIFSVAEMCPSEQPLSKVIENKTELKTYSMLRESLDENRTIYAIRTFTDNPADAILFFRGIENQKRIIQIEGKKHELISLNVLESEPPNEVPVLVSNNSDKANAILDLLPNRPVSIRVCSLFDLQGVTLNSFSAKDKQIIEKFSIEVISVNLLDYEEYMGGVVLCFANSYLREFKESINNEGNKVLLDFRERENKSIIGGKVLIVDERVQGNGFELNIKITETKMVIPIPCSPQELRTIIYSPNGTILEDMKGSFIQGFITNASISGPTRRITHTRKDGVEEEIIVETRNPFNSFPSPPVLSVTQKLRLSEERRMLNKLEKEHVFIYFPGGESSLQHAKTVIRKLLGSANSRCVICDTYLSGDDIIRFATLVSNTDVSIQLLSSQFFLKKNFDGSSISNLTHGEKMSKVLESILYQDRSLRIEAKLLLGSNKSPLHDRFLILDDEVYMLGSSLNEFGSRATTLFRIPDPSRLINQVEDWWQDDKMTIDLNQWLEEERVKVSTEASLNYIQKCFSVLCKVFKKLIHVKG
ncbi:hypothetical protein PAECIP111893_03613 [Paenibacillus plantiphilus]|uniref:PLD phosphodiesterase domain-containing protein n=1 Tax=Paenibacillus plantiphilus TaxID=2905650 RepID=A0ABN8GP93_9BACL|nr:VPA1262 family N-terminal domain-containing protein [Paenibacillus plantiphilus]CAH1213020.1 hypothetical protein PAECIP111893_03613 [Paenibacillus plantiphilus]